MSTKTPPKAGNKKFVSFAQMESKISAWIIMSQNKEISVPLDTMSSRTHFLDQHSISLTTQMMDLREGLEQVGLRSSSKMIQHNA